jgi:hypothetical protein
MLPGTVSHDDIKELRMVVLHVYDPSGASEIKRLHAKRMASLDYKTLP